MWKKESQKQDPTELAVKYKNIHYSDNRSSMTSIQTPLSHLCLQMSNYSNENTFEQSRPISCPVCVKMIAMSSILLHFYYDHSKVLKLRTSSSKRQHILVKASDISFETKCIAVLLMEGKTLAGSLDSVQTNTIRPLLLLAAKMDIRQLSKTNELKKRCIEDNHSQSQLSRNTFDQNEIVLFWTCKTESKELISNVKLSRRDKKLSFSYTGEAIHIREKQDAKNVHQHAECLILRGEAANNLLDEDDQMHVFIRCLRY